MKAEVAGSKRFQYSTWPKNHSCTAIAASTSVPSPKQNAFQANTRRQKGLRRTVAHQLRASVQILSPCPKNQVRVMTSRSVSRRMFGGKAANGVAMRTIL